MTVELWLTISQVKCVFDEYRKGEGTCHKIKFTSEHYHLYYDLVIEAIDEYRFHKNYPGRKKAFDKLRKSWAKEGM